jgi:hypothetical protein
MCSFTTAASYGQRDDSCAAAAAAYVAANAPVQVSALLRYIRLCLNEGLQLLQQQPRVNLCTLSLQDNGTTDKQTALENEQVEGCSTVLG